MKKRYTVLTCMFALMGILVVTVGSARAVTIDAYDEPLQVNSNTAPVELISQGSSGWDYRVIGGFAHQALANNFWSLHYGSVSWTTLWTGQAAFGNTLSTAGQSALGNWLDGQGLYLPSQTHWSWQTALVLKKTFTIADPSLVSDVTLNVASDNGYIIWINNGNNEVGRSLDDGFTSYWEHSHSIPEAHSIFTAGTNTLYALAIDDVPPQTWDATYFDLQLTARVTSTPSAAVPEPTTIALLGIGLAGLAGAEIRRRRKKKFTAKAQRAQRENLSHGRLITVDS